MMNKIVTGQVSSPLFNQPIIYTDGSVSRINIWGRHSVSGWGYIGTDGKFGVGSYIQPHVADPSVVAELKAIYRALVRYVIVEGKITKDFSIIYSDSTRAIDYIKKWRNGIEAMPVGYTGKTLLKFQRRLSHNDFNFEIIHVKGHSGDTFNECADTLAHLGMKWTRNKMTQSTVQKQAFKIAEDFLNDRSLVKI